MGKDKKTENTDMVLGICSYSREQYPMLLETADDRDALEDTHDEWLESYRKGIIRFRLMGIEPVKVDIDIKELLAYCKEKGLKNNGETRTIYSAELLQQGRGEEIKEHYMFNIEITSDNEILDVLGSIIKGIDIDSFKESAIKAGSPTELSEKWIKDYKIKGPAQDFLYEAALELWRRHLNHVKCPEVLSRFIGDIIHEYEKKDKEKDLNKEFLLDIYKKLEEFYQKLLGEDGSPDKEIFKELCKDSYLDFEYFLVTMPFAFSSHGLIDEAVDIGKWFADISLQPKNFYRDIGVILAESGRKEEALRQVEENLQRFPDDIWVIINAGDAMWALSDLKEAEKFFLKGYEIASEKYDKLGAIERLADLYNEMGLKDKSEEYIQEHERLTRPSSRTQSVESTVEPPMRPPINQTMTQIVKRKGKKIGRNEPCPCGSGKKYKKCCLKKEV